MPGIQDDVTARVEHKEVKGIILKNVLPVIDVVLGHEGGGDHSWAPLPAGIEGGRARVGGHNYHIERHFVITVAVNEHKSPIFISIGGSFVTHTESQ